MVTHDIRNLIQYIINAPNMLDAISHDDSLSYDKGGDPPPPPP